MTLRFLRMTYFKLETGFYIKQDLKVTIPATLGQVNYVKFHFGALSRFKETVKFASALLDQTEFFNFLFLRNYDIARLVQLALQI